MNMDTVTEMLINNEGMVLHCYKDHLGLDTIGIGRLVHENKGGITEDEAKFLLANDIQTVCDRLDRNFPFWRDLSENRQHVMIDLSFNLGNRLNQFKNFLSHLQTGDYEPASKHLLDSKYAKQVPNRANRNADLIREG